MSLDLIVEYARRRQQHYLDQDVPAADELIAAGTHVLQDEEELPRYAGWAWRALPSDDPRWLAGVLVAAEAWRRHNSTEATAERLRMDVAAEDERCLQRWRGAMNDVRGAHRITDIPAVYDRPTHAEMEARRREPKPFPGEGA